MAALKRDLVPSYVKLCQVAVKSKLRGSVTRNTTKELRFFKILG